MKANILVILLTILLATGVGFAQSIAEIQKRYTELAETARLCETDDEKGEYGELVMNTLSINSRAHQWRAVGIYTQTFKFFYKGGDSEHRLYPDQLVFVKTERTVSNRTYAEEFLFSETGALLFYLQASQNDDKMPAERRVYFSRGKAVRVIEDNKTRDRLLASDMGVVKGIVAQSRQISDIFVRSIKL